jgi:glycosyltransferase involved in cell wall biosynthesis
VWEARDLVEVVEEKICFEVDMPTLGSPLVVVGIPAFNEEKTIAEVILGAQKYADIVIVCDDGSYDMTAEISENLGAVVIRHPVNVGYGGALQSLFKKAREFQADVLVTLDSDGQHNPAEIPSLIKPIEEGVAEVVFGSRFIGGNGTAEMPVYRQFGIKVITKLAAGSDNTITDGQSGFRAYSKQALASLFMSDKGMGASIELLRAVKKKRLLLCEVPISCKYSESLGCQTSSEHPFTHGLGLIWSMFKLAVNERPLFFLGVPGLVSLMVGALFGVLLLNSYVSTAALATNVILAFMGFMLLGFFAVSTSIILYAISRLSKKIC